MSRIVALVPMRHLSERVPGKNYRSFDGRPLFRHIVEALLACEAVDEVVIDTDSPAIMADASEHFESVRVLERPKHLREGTTSMNEVILHVVDRVDSEFYLQTHCTNPLLSSDTIQRAIDTFLEHYPQNDSLFGVTRLGKFLWNEVGLPINHNPNFLMRTQDLPPVYAENSCIYLFDKEGFLARKHRIGVRPRMFEIDPVEAWDIDDEFEFLVGEFLSSRMRDEHDRASGSDSGGRQP